MMAHRLRTQPWRSRRAIPPFAAARTTCYCERGCIDGFDVDDWYQAERELPSPVASV